MVGYALTIELLSHIWAKGANTNQGGVAHTSCYTFLTYIQHNESLQLSSDVKFNKVGKYSYSIKWYSIADGIEIIFP